MTMDRASLTAALELALGDAASKVPNGALDEHLDAAAGALARRRPRIRMGNLSLTPGRNAYPAPADLIAVDRPLWGQQQRASRRPWDRGYPRRLPRLSLMPGPSGDRQLLLTPAPLAEDIGELGAEYRYTYHATHTVATNAAETTVPAAERDLLILRATAGAMQALANTGTVAPVQLSRAGASAPTSATPAAVAADLWARWEREVIQ